VAVSHQHLRESQALHLDYYKRKEKKIFRIKETCTRRPRACPRGDEFPLASASARGRPRRWRHYAKRIVELQKRPSNGGFCGAQI